MVAFLTKTEGNDDFADIVDFLNASSIRYSLTVNPTVYVSSQLSTNVEGDAKQVVIVLKKCRKNLYGTREGKAPMLKKMFPLKRKLLQTVDDESAGLRNKRMHEITSKHRKQKHAVQ
ncbi:hypothetical protein Tco_1080886 [Tanacetum coccineum]|uniref:Uncharacterized protein n=1 Tax=Tanacetum coccineum TaxID=301880 RepID=A0ABQ5HW12_9ASTR